MSDLQIYGPLAALIGTWRGSTGDDTAPADDRGIEKNPFREEMVFTPVGAANNHEQTLYCIGYTRTAWRLKEENPFHAQLGYWLWDPAAKRVMHSFMIPRGMTVLAAGPADADSTILEVKATRGSTTFGICSNPFLEEEFRTVAYEGQLTLHNPNLLSYREDTQIQIKGQKDVFHHVDQNRLEKLNDRS